MKAVLAGYAMRGRTDEAQRQVFLKIHTGNEEPTEEETANLRNEFDFGFLSHNSKAKMAGALVIKSFDAKSRHYIHTAQAKMDTYSHVEMALLSHLRTRYVSNDVPNNAKVIVWTRESPCRNCVGGYVSWFKEIKSKWKTPFYMSVVFSSWYTKQEHTNSDTDSNDVIWDNFTQARDAYEKLAEDVNSVMVDKIGGIQFKGRFRPALTIRPLSETSSYVNFGTHMTIGKKPA